MNSVRNVKSARRVMDVLRRFDEERRPQRTAELARATAMPISSCLALLSTMVEQRTLHFDEASRTYIRQLTDWIAEENSLEGRAIYLARRLHRELRAPTAVTRRAGLYLEWLYTLRVTRCVPGERRPLCATVNGLAVLSRLSDAQIVEIVAAHNERFGRHQLIDYRQMLERVRALRGRGYVSLATPIVPGLAAICFLIPDERNDDEVFLTVEVSAAELEVRERKIVAAARRLIPELSIRTA